MYYHIIFTPSYHIYQTIIFQPHPQVNETMQFSFFLKFLTHVHDKAYLSSIKYASETKKAIKYSVSVNL